MRGLILGDKLLMQGQILHGAVGESFWERNLEQCEASKYTSARFGNAEAAFLQVQAKQNR